MIRYQLVCARDHEFEGWFSNSAAFDDQVKHGLVICPHCGLQDVSKAPMAPSIARRETSSKNQREIVEVLREARNHILKSSENVGDKFAEEARKIHREEVEPRSIYGNATADEADSLQDEGVDFHPLPVLPEDHN
ncbi:MAG: DUF1178 family protein [Hyphomicrobiaceae bacterium]|nr:DUF1178 family protein [Hyphomicrobiaceae bacterium]